jgi:hypothetical protein
MLKFKGIYPNEETTLTNGVVLSVVVFYTSSRWVISLYLEIFTSCIYHNFNLDLSMNVIYDVPMERQCVFSMTISSIVYTVMFGLMSHFLLYVVIFKIVPQFQIERIQYVPLNCLLFAKEYLVIQ